MKPESPPDEMAVTIEQVDAELERALGSLDGWAEDVLARERDRIHELHFQKLRRLDLVHAQPPTVDLAQIDLLSILVVAIRGE